MTGGNSASGSNAPSAAQGAGASGENGANGQSGANQPGASGANGANGSANGGANAAAPGPLDANAFQQHLDQLTAAAPLDFAAYSKDLSPEAAKTVDQIAALLNASPAIKVSVMGHANGQFVNQEQAQTLSQQRADAIATELEAKGIAKDRITAKGAGAGTGDEAGARRAMVKVQA